MTAINHTEQPFDEILENRLFRRDIPKDGQIVCRIMSDGWEIGTWTESDREGAGPVARKILAVNDLLAACKALVRVIEDWGQKRTGSLAYWAGPSLLRARDAVAKAEGVPHAT